MKWRIGCSGFYYKEWKTVFYPEGLAQKNWFSYYCQHFNTIEINASFYKMPTLKSLEKWYQDSPPDFLFTLKAPRLITHYKQLVNCKALLDDFYTLAQQGLKEKLACILFQFPPKYDYQEHRLTLLTDLLDPTFSNVVEFRHSSWWDERIIAALAKAHLIFSGQSYPATLPDLVVQNQSTIYYRFHGRPVLYKSTYPIETIQDIRNQIDDKAEQAFIYFNNTWGTGALHNAQQLQKLVGQV